MDAEEGPVALLQAQVLNIVEALHRQMKENSLLTELILVLPGALATHMVQLIPGIHFTFLPHLTLLVTPTRYTSVLLCQA